MKLSSAIPAREFLKLVSATLNLQYVSDAPVPADLLAQAREYEEKMKSGTRPPPGMRPGDYSRDIAWGAVRYKNGSSAMEGAADGDGELRHELLSGNEIGAARHTGPPGFQQQPL
jgi:hypothetical protein